jgi:hypothetical protein
MLKADSIGPPSLLEKGCKAMHLLCKECRTSQQPSSDAQSLTAAEPYVL